MMDFAEKLDSINDYNEAVKAACQCLLDTPQGERYERMNRMAQHIRDKFTRESLLDVLNDIVHEFILGAPCTGQQKA